MSVLEAVESMLTESDVDSLFSFGVLAIEDSQGVEGHSEGTNGVSWEEKDKVDRHVHLPTFEG